MSNRNVATQAAVDLIKRFEGCKLETYLCPARIPTIGWGHTQGVRLGDKITQARADELLASDVDVYARGIDAWLDSPVSQGSFDACCALAFNIGLGAFQSSTLLRKIEGGDKLGASLEFARWNKGGGVVLPGLVKRREAERVLFLS